MKCEFYPVSVSLLHVLHIQVLRGIGECISSRSCPKVIHFKAGNILITFLVQYDLLNLTFLMCATGFTIVIFFAIFIYAMLRWFHFLMCYIQSCLVLVLMPSSDRCFSWMVHMIEKLVALQLPALSLLLLMLSTEHTAILISVLRVM